MPFSSVFSVDFEQVNVCWVLLRMRFSDFFNSFMTEVSIIYRNQSINLLCKSMDWFLYDRNLRHERVNKIVLYFL